MDITSVGFVSKAFYDAAGYDLKNDGILCIKLNHNYVLPTTNTIYRKIFRSSQTDKVFAPTSYIENSFKILLGICGLAFVICLSAYLLIYNILYLSVSKKIRYYGLLQSLGMTKKQLVRIIALSNVVYRYIRNMHWKYLVNTSMYQIGSLYFRNIRDLNRKYDFIR